MIIAPDKDAPGKHYALSVAGIALAQGASIVRVINVWQLSDWSSGDDLADHTVPVEFLDSAVDACNLFSQTELDPHVVKAAASLSYGDFDRLKKRLATKLGITVNTFGKLVKEARVKDRDAETPQNVTTMFPDDALEPWDEPVNGEILFAEIVALINRHVVLAHSQAVAVAIWIIFSWGFDSMNICPKLLINSPSKRCGKSTLMELLLCLVRRALPASNITPAAIYRSIDKWQPTLLIDEADTFLNKPGNEEMTGILNSGHTCALAFVVRIQETNGEFMPVRFSTFCPQVIAMIKNPADTLIDRSIVVTLVRKLVTQRVRALGINSSNQMKDTRRKILRWITDHKNDVSFDIEAIPQISNDRARQNWATMAAFSQVLGPQAHTMLLTAVAELSDTSDIEDNLEIDLLTDIREILNTQKGDRIQSTVLSKELGKMKERPWCEFNHGKGLSENRLSRMLKPFKIEPNKFRDGAVTHRGYSVAALNAVFDRYLTVKSGGEA